MSLSLPPWRSLRRSPSRDLIVLTAFSVVLCTLAIQGLTLKPLLGVLAFMTMILSATNWLLARDRALRAGLASFASDRSPVAEVVRQQFMARLARRTSGY